MAVLWTVRTVLTSITRTVRTSHQGRRNGTTRAGAGIRDHTTTRRTAHLTGATKLGPIKTVQVGRRTTFVDSYLVIVTSLGIHDVSLIISRNDAIQSDLGLKGTRMRPAGTVLTSGSEHFTGLAHLPHIALPDIESKRHEAPQDHKQDKNIFQKSQPSSMARPVVIHQSSLN
jgi:hypothetical protein